MQKRLADNSISNSLEEYGLDFALLQGCMLYHYASGEVILEQGMPVEALFLLVRGKVKVCMLAANGKDLTLCYYLDRGLLGDVEFVQEDRAASATSIAACPTDCIAIPLKANQDYLSRSAAFMRQVARELSSKLLGSDNSYMASALYTGEQRLCAYILTAERGGVFAEVLTDVAKSIGVSYRHLLRMCSCLCQKGVLEKRGSGFVLLDRQYLTRRCAE